MKKINPKVFSEPEDNTWINVHDKLPPTGHEVFVAYIPKHNTGIDRNLEYSYCTAYYDGEKWSVKDQLLYRERFCIVKYWRKIDKIKE